MKAELERLRCRAEMVSALPVRTGGMAGHTDLELDGAERILDQCDEELPR